MRDNPPGQRDAHGHSECCQQIDERARLFRHLRSDTCNLFGQGCLKEGKVRFNALLVRFKLLSN